MISLLQNKAKAILEYLYMILSKFFIGTIKGIKFFSIQIFMWIAIELFFYMLGFTVNWGRFGVLALSLLICIFAYTMFYSWFYSFVQIRLKNIFIPYIIYAGLVYLEIVKVNDWNFKIVTVDKYMLGGWLIPLYGLSILILKKLIKKWLCNYPKIMNMIRIVLNVFTVLLVCLILFIFLKGRL